MRGVRIGARQALTSGVNGDNEEPRVVVSKGIGEKSHIREGTFKFLA